MADRAGAVCGPQHKGNKDKSRRQRREVFAPWKFFLFWIFLSFLCQTAGPLNQPLCGTLSATSNLNHALNMDEGTVEPDC